MIERIGEEAERSGVPLDDDEKEFLVHLPTQPTNPTASWGFNTAYEDPWPTPVLRDLRFERLCNLARDAHLHDLRARPDAAREWEFASAVLKLHRHPLSWLLQWAHVRTAKRPERWDRLLLVGTATLVVMVFILGAIALSVLTEVREMLGGGRCGLSVDASMAPFSHFSTSACGGSNLGNGSSTLKNTDAIFRCAVLLPPVARTDSSSRSATPSSQAPPAARCTRDA